MSLNFLQAFFTDCYLFVVIQDGVHALYPQGVDGPIEDHPLALGGLGQREFPEGRGDNPVCPLPMGSGTGTELT